MLNSLEKGSNSKGKVESGKEKPERSFQIQIPQISLPKGGGAIRGIEEKFQVNSITGTSSFSIPFPLSSSRSGSIPDIGLNYNSGSGNSPFGIGWQLAIPSIARKTEKKLPEYKDNKETDTFILSGAEDLVPLLEKKADGTWKKVEEPRVENGINYSVKNYIPRVEGLFSRIEKWHNLNTGETHWKTITKNNIHSYFGKSEESRIGNPKDNNKIFEWMLCQTHDDKGNITTFSYKREDFAGISNKLSEKNRVNNCTQRYLKQILYGNKKPFFLGDTIPGEDEFMFKVVLDYGEHDASEDIPKDIDVEKKVWTCRKDPFSSYRSGFEIRTYRRCNRIMVFHCFSGIELPHTPYLTKSLQLIYDEDLILSGNKSVVEGFSFLIRARQNGHLWDENTNSYKTKILPEIEINYQKHEWNTEIKSVSTENLIHSPAGFTEKNYLWIDLFNEGISGILTEKADGWFYKSNLGNGNFSNAKPVAPKPSVTGISPGKLTIQELGQGTKYLVKIDKEPKGYFKITDEDDWEPMKNFESFPNFDTLDPNIREIDLNGDGIADLLMIDDLKLNWFAGQGEKGFEVSQSITKEIDEEKGPAIVFADREQCIFLADMSGDGLTDIVRIRNGEICYWPNLGYGHFGSKVSMDNAPLFDYPDTFNPYLLRLADIDGSGTTDVIYLGKNDFRVWMNLSGNEWSKVPQIINAFPNIDSLSDVAILDFLGSGTACIVYSSPLNVHPLQYIDLMGSKKPHLLNGYQNNCGKEVFIEYKASTFFYLEDKKKGNKWITKLPFPVHCIYKVRSEDKIRETIFTCSYRYHHGYFDNEENEFRGFAKVEQLDTEEFAQFKINAAKNVVAENLHQPPVKTVSWFHPGVFLRSKKVIHQFENEYFKNEDFNEYDFPEPDITNNFPADLLAEAYRSCKGLLLRREVYAEDNSNESLFPYSVSQSTYDINLIQPKNENKYASFLIVPSESVSYGYERKPWDPRIIHSFVLETDELGNVKKSCSVIYPRITRPVSANAIPDKVWEEQNKMHIVYGETLYTTNDILEDNVYRLRAGYESKSYEINGIAQPVDFYFKKDSLKTSFAATTEILFEEDFDGTMQKRLTAHSRGYFYKDDLSGELPLGVLSKLGIPQKSYQLAFTKNLVTKYYGNKVDSQMLIDAKYVHNEGDEHWWTQSGELIFPSNPKDKFYKIIGNRDVFGNESFLEYDQYFFLINKTVDAISNSVILKNDYRTLSPVMVTDPNMNRTIVETDELGMIIKSAVMGKAGAGEGDTLADPSVKMEYDFFNWKHNGKPNYVHMYAREQHGSVNPRWQEIYVYSDGGGEVIMSKSQVEPGTAKRWNSVTKQVEEVNADPRWIGNGRTIYNNKGRPIKQYEPFFSTNNEYEHEDALVETGVTPVLFYDPIGRNTRTEYPNGTFTKAEFDAWHSKSFDVNDTVKDSQWFTDRNSPDPLGGEPNDSEERAAWLASKHYNTPSIVYSDSLNKTIYATEDYGNGKTVSVFSEEDLAGRFSRIYDQFGRNISEGYVNLLGDPIYGKTAEKGERWIFTDVAGRLVKIWDSNDREMYSTFDKLHRTVSTFVKEGTKEIMIAHVVYGDIIADDIAREKNLKNRTYQIYDQAGVITIKKFDFNGNATEVERKLSKEYKQNINWAALNGLTDIAAIQAAASPFLETQPYSSLAQLDALGRPIEVTLPDNSVFQPKFNEANLLESLKVKVRGAGNFVTFLDGQSYDAKGQRQFVKYGNGTITKYFYDPKTFRLINLVTKLNETDSDAKNIQNISYTFDPVGNITQIIDDAQQTYFFRNAVVYPENKYEYDAIYQLKKATGREHAGLNTNTQHNESDLPFVQLPHQNNATAVRNYIEQYEYDDCGNIKRLQHIAANGSWTTRYKYEYEDDPANKTNRLKATSMPGDAEGIYSATYMHDLRGNMTSMPHLSAPDSMKWEYMDMLKEVNLGGGGTAYYVYGLGNNRVRKIIERPGGKILEHIYMGALEIHRERQTNGVLDFERSTLHISDNIGNIAQIDTKTIDTNNKDTFNQLNENVVRYQYTNHLGSANLETDNNGNILSYEEYHPFGTSAYRASRPDSNISLKRYRFSGKERDDETGFYYFGARYYSAWLGRWTSSDPAGYVSGVNLYRYCSNSPIVFFDQNGMEEEKKPYSITHEFTGKESLEDMRKFLWEHGKIMAEPGINESNYKERYTKGKGKEGSGGVWHFDVRARTDTDTFEGTYPAKVAESGGGAVLSAGAKAVINNNPTGFTLEVPDNFDQGKVKAYKQRITDPGDRGVGIRSKPSGARTSTADLRAANQGLRDAFEAGLEGGARPPGTQIDHTVELQHIIRGNNAPGADTVRPQDHRVQNSSQNASQGSTARAVKARQVANGAPMDTSAGGVAKSSEIGRFYNKEGFRTGMRWGGYGLAGAGTVYSAYQFGEDISEGNWFGAALSGTGFTGGALVLGGTAVGAATGTTSGLVAAGTVIGAPAAVIGAGAAGWALGTYTNNNTAISDVAMAGGSAIESLTGSRTAGAVGAAATAVLVAPVFVPIAIGKGIGRGASWVWNKIF